MKNKITLISLIALGSWSLMGMQKASDIKAHKYDIEKGKIVYQYSGMQSGTETVWFDHWGMREAKHTQTTTTVAGFTTKANNYSIMDGMDIYTIDLNTKQGTHMINNILKPYLDDEDALQDLGEKMLKQMGGEPDGTGTVAGKSCQKYKVEQLQTETWVWKWVSMKTVSNMMGMNQTIEAISIEENVDIPEDKFKLDASWSIREMGNLTIPNK